MSRRPSLKDVAELARVSTATVSHVINNTRFVEPATAERVRLAIAELHYVNNSWAKMLRSKKSDIIGMMIYDLVNPYSVTITNCALELVRARGYQLYIMPVSNDDGESVGQAVQRLLSYRAAGVLSLPLDESSLRSIRDQMGSIPMCCIGGDLELCDTVDTNHQQATYDAVRLIARKHTRIGFVQGRESYRTTKNRFLGYKGALQNAGITFRPEYVAYGNSTVAGGCEATRTLLKTDITALFVANDLMLQGAVQAIAETGGALFDRLAIVGFDDPEWSSFYRPTITTIRQPLAEMVAKAVELLFLRMQDPNRSFENHIIPAQLICRESFRI